MIWFTYNFFFLVKYCADNHVWYDIVPFCRNLHTQKDLVIPPGQKFACAEKLEMDLTIFGKREYFFPEIDTQKSTWFCYTSPRRISPLYQAFNINRFALPWQPLYLFEVPGLAIGPTVVLCFLC